MSVAPLEVLVEELSAEMALRILLPKIIPGTAFEIRSLQGEDALFKKLPQRLAGYATWPAAAPARVVVLVDRDDDDCVELRHKLDALATAAGLQPRGPGRRVLDRIAIEELEAWFFGDIDAVACAFPRVPRSATKRSGLRDPDAIRGGTAEAFGRLLQRHGYHEAGLAKATAAGDVAIHMNINDNASRSFQVFRDGIRELAETRSA